MSSTVIPSQRMPAGDGDNLDGDNLDVISLEIPVETPECVLMTYRVAGPASRVGAYLLDTAVRVGILIAVAMIVSCSGVIAQGVSMGVFLVSWFVVEWFYFAISEAVFNGRTIGKRVMGIRTIEQYGYPLSWWSALVRNFLRTADCLMFYGIGFVSMLMTSRFQRLGDLVAGTVVVHEHPVRLPREPVILETIKPLNREHCNHFVPSERTLSLIDELLSRRMNSRERIPHYRGHSLARELAKTLSEKLNYQGDFDQVSDYSMAFLARVYVTFQSGDFPDAEQTKSEVAPFGLQGASR